MKTTVSTTLLLLIVAGVCYVLWMQQETLTLLADKVGTLEAKVGDLYRPLVPKPRAKPKPKGETILP